MTYVDAYLQSRVLGADPVELILMLYERAIVSLNIAKESILGGVDDPELLKRKATELGRATNIIYYLHDTLDRERGGQIADNLATIYSILTEELVRANLFNDVEIISKCISILNNLKASWEDVKKEMREKQNAERKSIAAAV